MNIDLIKRNLTEIVTEDEFINLLKEKSQPTTYCGYETSGPVHIGTMVAINKQIDFICERPLNITKPVADVKLPGCGFRMRRRSLGLH